MWRAEIVLLSAAGVGTNEIMRRTGKSKTCVWTAAMMAKALDISASSVHRIWREHSL